MNNYFGHSALQYDAYWLSEVILSTWSYGALPGHSRSHPYLGLPSRSLCKAVFGQWREDQVQDRPQWDWNLTNLTCTFPSKAVTGMSGNDFCAFGNGNRNKKYCSQRLGTGTGIGYTVPNIGEREREQEIGAYFPRNPSKTLDVF